MSTNSPTNKDEGQDDVGTSNGNGHNSNGDNDAGVVAVSSPQPEHALAVLDTSTSSHTTTTTKQRRHEEMISKRRKEVFGDCALIEIIHLHDCLRGALKALEADVNELVRLLSAGICPEDRDVTTSKSPAMSSINNTDSHSRVPPPQQQQHLLSPVVTDLERRVAGRFKVIWSVFKSHSEAEDEFIWPALNIKSQGEVNASPNHSPRYTPSGDHHHHSNGSMTEDAGNGKDPLVGTVPTALHHDETVHLEQEEYKEDHADEERMFSEMDTILMNLRTVLLSDSQSKMNATSATISAPKVPVESTSNHGAVVDLARILSDHTRHLSQHLMAHLEKEETQCMPLVVKYLAKEEIHELVGNIMGKRSADTIAQIMTMAVQNLDVADREEMVKYMKQSMAGTYFDRWLTMSGWNGSTTDVESSVSSPAAEEQDQGDASKDTIHAATLRVPMDPGDIVSNQIQYPEEPEYNERKRPALPLRDIHDQDSKRVRVDDDRDEIVSQVTEPSMYHPDIALASSTLVHSGSDPSWSLTGQAELEKLIRAIATNPSLTPAQKNTTIQGLRDSVWKSNQRQKDLILGPPTVVNVSVPNAPIFPQPLPHASMTVSTTSGSSLPSTGKGQRTTPSMYFKKSKDGKIELVWSSDDPLGAAVCVPVPLFTAAELAPTHHDGASGAVLGCPHYARACKLRHPKSGRLYTCRLCCEQTREMPMKDKDEPLDRYAVTEVMCMKCNALQPAEDRCINPHCESRGKPFARYFCRICHLYDDGSRPIFHCPYCNACRLGLGLGIDFRHCMRCNACVSLSDTEHHCIPQSLQGSCPICRESLFESTEPLRGLKCGHVMHLACFTDYRRGLAYTCPLCKQSMEDMKDYFALLDTAIRMQPMPAAYLSTYSNILCQDCGETGRTRYHFVGQKCPSCSSYNTRELGRVHESPNSSPRQNSTSAP